ncbi:BQ2448_7737 [Microbotryum intermedium]|uniref:BQ2448_7737 protein n=1 Tax=Microbotryum intermedium TaxID=269621 RepID=A0A238FU06_9BASI|nr:BQ2448_7737 [Microbotryum intermedium]
MRSKLLGRGIPLYRLPFFGLAADLRTALCALPDTSPKIAAQYWCVPGLRYPFIGSFPTQQDRGDTSSLGHILRKPNEVFTSDCSLGLGISCANPLAPSLFVLAIEGFACQIRSRVKGIGSGRLQTIRELLFTDDACCALHDISDLDHLNEAIRVYERASASKLSNTKSFLYPLGSFRNHPMATHVGTRRLSDSQFRYLGIQSATIAHIRSIPMYDLPYAAKCSIINIYCYTKVLFYNRFLTAPKNVVKEIEDAAMLAIYGRDSDGTRRRPMVSRSRLCTPLDHGGFGLIDLPMRLAIDHAKWAFQLRDPDGCFIPHLFDPPPSQHRRPRIWIWWAYFCHPPPKWNHAVRETRRLLPPRWARYFELGRHQKIFSFPEQRWKSWWKALRKIRRVHSDAEDTAHLLSLGSLHPGVQLSSATHSQLNNRSASYVMCLSEAPESLPHLAVGCPFARRLWAALSPSPHPIFADFVYPLVSRSERRLVELRVL